MMFLFSSLIIIITTALHFFSSLLLVARLVEKSYSLTSENIGSGHNGSDQNNPLSSISMHIHWFIGLKLECMKKMVASIEVCKLHNCYCYSAYLSDLHQHCSINQKINYRVCTSILITIINLLDREQQCVEDYFSSSLACAWPCEIVTKSLYTLE